MRSNYVLLIKVANGLNFIDSFSKVCFYLTIKSKQSIYCTKGRLTTNASSITIISLLKIPFWVEVKNMHCFQTVL